jgi:AmmeMemoRadiSam system protein B/AmmeMemoRadiSam system protein A
MRGGSKALAATRPPAVAGTFYPRARAELHAEVVRLLGAAEVRVARRPKALVVPHAGYVYSGPVAASAYAQLRAPGPRVERVVLVGPAHHVAVAGLALPEATRLLTPRGEVAVDEALAAQALRLPQVTRSAAVHALEHSLEVQLPFLQEVLDDFTVLPLAVGRATPAEVAAVLEAVWGGDETLLVISTDLSHFLESSEARALDEQTARQVLALDAAGLGPEQACGRLGLAGMLLAARRHGLAAELLDLRNSGDTAGDPDSVVGYAAFALSPAAAGPGRASDEPTRRAAEEHHRRARLVTDLARAAIRSLFGGPAPARPAGEPWLEARRACFVSLHRRGELRGCVGATEPRAALFEELVHCARAAAAEDVRFDPVTEAELAGLDVEVSVLTPLEPVEAEDETSALRALRPGVDGLLLEAAGRRAVFIPAMWEQLPDPADFLFHLRRKAGLPQTWLPGTRLFRFTAERYQETP